MRRTKAEGRSKLVKYVRCTGPALSPLARGATGHSTTATTRLDPQFASLSAAWLLFRAELAFSCLVFCVLYLVACGQCGVRSAECSVCCVCVLCLVANIRDTSANDIFTLLRSLTQIIKPTANWPAGRMRNTSGHGTDQLAEGRGRP